MRIIGITGPSGAGKTRLTEYLSALGLPIINADGVYHSMLKPPSACLDAIREHFGGGVFTPEGALDRTALAHAVFGDAEKLNTLNRAVLGIVLAEIRRKISALEESGERTVIVDAPTLIESGFNAECETVISVLCPAERRIRRIALRDGITPEAAAERVRAQKDDAFYTAHSDRVIFNGGSENEFDEKIRLLAGELELQKYATERNTYRAK